MRLTSCYGWGILSLIMELRLTVVSTIALVVDVHDRYPDYDCHKYHFLTFIFYQADSF